MMTFLRLITFALSMVLMKPVLAEEYLLVTVESAQFVTQPAAQIQYRVKPIVSLSSVHTEPNSFEFSVSHLTTTKPISVGRKILVEKAPTQTLVLDVFDAQEENLWQSSAFQKVYTRILLLTLNEQNTKHSVLATAIAEFRIEKKGGSSHVTFGRNFTHPKILYLLQYYAKAVFERFIAYVPSASGVSLNVTVIDGLFQFREIQIQRSYKTLTQRMFEQ